MSESKEISRILSSCVRALQDESPYNHVFPMRVTSLITLDADGLVSSRAVQPRERSDDLSYFRIQTWANTRKVAELRRNPVCSMTFVDQRGRGGWLTFKGRARLEERRDGEIDIHFDVLKLEAMDYNEKIMQDRDGWEPETLVRSDGKWKRVKYSAAA